jgi:hypothetical protein
MPPGKVEAAAATAGQAPSRRGRNFECVQFGVRTLCRHVKWPRALRAAITRDKPSAPAVPGSNLASREAT